MCMGNRMMVCFVEQGDSLGSVPFVDDKTPPKLAVKIHYWLTACCIMFYDHCY